MFMVQEIQLYVLLNDNCINIHTQSFFKKWVINDSTGSQCWITQKEILKTMSSSMTKQYWPIDKEGEVVADEPNPYKRLSAFLMTMSI